MIKKELAVVVIVLFLSISVMPVVIGDNPASMTFYLIGKQEVKQKQITLPIHDANYIYEMYETLSNAISSHPFSDQTQNLKNEFIDLLEKKELISQDFSKRFTASLTPVWVNKIKGFGPMFHNTLSSATFSSTATALFCSITSGGSGTTTPIVITPRPRAIIFWRGIPGHEETVTAVGGIYTEKGFIALGEQNGVAVGFEGVGLTYGTPFGTVFGLTGYALYTSVTAENIMNYPPNNPPSISDENPPSGTHGVSISLSQLGFKIDDDDNDRMSYHVTTNPNIGSGSGNNKNNGYYSISISDLEPYTNYRWTVEVSDGKDTTTEEFSFRTEEIPFDPFEEGWRYRKKVTINHNKVTGSLNDFPVLISATDSDLRSKAQNDGDDILFMDDSGVANRLYHEIEEYDGPSGKLVAWVKIPSLSSTVDAKLYMYYGNSVCSNQEDITGVWDSYSSRVYHLNDDSGTIVKESTKNNKHGTKKSNVEPSKDEGIVSYSQHYDGVDDSIRLPNINANRYTIEGWFNRDTVWDASNTGREFIYGARDQNPDIYVAFWEDFDGKLIFRHCGPDDNLQTIRDSWSSDTWYYFSATYDGSTKRIYINGEEKNSISYANGRLKAGQSHHLGSYYRDPLGVFDGRIDEFRISNIARSPDWIKTSYNSMRYPSSFLSFGPEESGP